MDSYFYSVSFQRVGYFSIYLMQAVNSSILKVHMCVHADVHRHIHWGRNASESKLIKLTANKMVCRALQLNAESHKCFAYVSFSLFHVRPYVYITYVEHVMLHSEVFILYRENDNA